MSNGNEKLKIVNTKLAKQVSSYTLIQYDMQHAARAFRLAAKYKVRSKSEFEVARPSVFEKMGLLLQLDPFLRIGAGVAIIDPDNRNDDETIRCGLFEAGIITYARCFNSGLRTRLSETVFKGDLLERKKFHDAIISLRNKHLAHSELKMERSIIGCRLIADQNYGARPSMVMVALAMRRHSPTNEKLEQLGDHCEIVLREIIHPKILESTKALREQLLQMPPAQLDTFPQFGSSTEPLDELL